MAKTATIERTAVIVAQTGIREQRRELFDEAEKILWEWAAGVEPDATEMHILFDCFHTLPAVNDERRRIANVRRTLEFASASKLQSAEDRLADAKAITERELPEIDAKMAALQARRSVIVGERDSAQRLRDRIIGMKPTFMEAAPPLIRDQTQRTEQAINQSALGKRVRELESEIEWRMGVQKLGGGDDAEGAVQHLHSRTMAGDADLPQAVRGRVSEMDLTAYKGRRLREAEELRAELATKKREFEQRIDEARAPRLHYWNR